jgi:hypothetical protein
MRRKRFAMVAGGIVLMTRSDVVGLRWTGDGWCWSLRTLILEAGSFFG